MPDTPDVQYVTITSPSQVKGPRPCICGCGGNPRHREKVTMEEWAEPGPDGKLQVPLLYATQLSAGEKDRHSASLEEFDDNLKIFVRHPEWIRSHWLAFCLRDHQNHRIWEDLTEARRQLEECDDDEIDKLVDACNKAQRRPRAEGNAVGPGRSETTSNGKPSGGTRKESATPILTGS